MLIEEDLRWLVSVSDLPLVSLAGVRYTGRVTVEHDGRAAP